MAVGWFVVVISEEDDDEEEEDGWMDDGSERFRFRFPNNNEVQEGIRGARVGFSVVGICQASWAILLTAYAYECGSLCV